MPVDAFFRYMLFMNRDTVVVVNLRSPFYSSVAPAVPAGPDLQAEYLVPRCFLFQYVNYADCLFTQQFNWVI